MYARLFMLLMNEAGGDMGGGGDAAPAVDTSVNTSDSVPSGGGEQDAKPATGDATESKPAKQAGRSRKLKHRGEEFDFDPDNDEHLEQLSQRLSKPYRIKVDGSERDFTYEDLTKDAGRAAASYDRMRKAAEIQKGHERWKADLKGEHPRLMDFLMEEMDIDPWDFLLNEHKSRLAVEELGIPLEGLSEEQNEARRQEYLRQREERARQEERRAIERERRKADAEANAAAEKERNQRFYQELGEQLKARGLPINDVTLGTVQRMIKRMEGFDEEMKPDAIAYDAQRAVREALASGLPEDIEALAEFLGPERLKALAKREIARAKGSPASNAPASKAKKPSDSNGAPKGSKSASEIMSVFDNWGK